MIFVVLIGLFHIITGIVTAKKVFNPVNRTELLLTAGLVAYVTFYIAPVFIGWTSGAMNWFVIGFSAVFAISSALLAILFSGRLSSTPSEELPQTVPTQRRFRGEWITWCFGSLLLLLLLLAGSVLPARTYDAVTYHMSNPMSWHRSGKFILESHGEKELHEQMVSAECAPNVKAVLPFLVMLITEDIPGTSLAQFPFLLLLIVSVRAIGLRMGVRPALASVAAFSVIAVPEIFLQSLEAYADVIFLCSQMVILWAVIILWQEPLSIRSLALGAAGFGLMAGAKASFLSTGSAMACLYIVLLSWKAMRSQHRKALVYIPAWMIMVVIAILVTGGPWYIHAWKKFHNPVFPIKISVGEKVIFDGRYKPTVNEEMLRIYTKTSGKEAYWNTLRDTGRWPIFNDWSGGLGANLFILGLASSCLFLIRGMWNEPGASGRRLLIAGTFVFSVTCPTLAIVRFSLYQPVIALLTIAWIASISPCILRYIIILGSVCLSCFDLAMTGSAIQYRTRPPELVAFNLLSGYPVSAHRDTYPDDYTALDYWREEVSRPGLKLGLPPSAVPAWYTYAPGSPADALRYRNPNSVGEADSWYNELKNHGVTHLYMPFKQSGYDVALMRPDLFKPLIKRNGGRFSGKRPFWYEAWPRDVLFELAWSDTR